MSKKDIIGLYISWQRELNVSIVQYNSKLLLPKLHVYRQDMVLGQIHIHVSWHSLLDNIQNEGLAVFGLVKMVGLHSQQASQLYALVISSPDAMPEKL